MNEDNKGASAEAGSATGAPATGAGQAQATGTGAAGDKGATGTGESQNYQELEKKLGEQGRELGEYRDFIKGITPLLNKLDDNPEFAKAIAEGKVDSKLMGAILEGKVKIEEAQQVAAAHEQVKQEMGNKAYGQASPEEITRLVTETVSKSLNEQLEQKFKDAEESQNFAEGVNAFISNTPDFPEFADKISAWLTEHPDQSDIETAYLAVKGKAALEAAAAQTGKDQGEAAKNIAANAGGGNAPASGKVTNQVDPWDQLVAPRGNPNVL